MPDFSTQLRVVLASGSPSRKALLLSAGVEPDLGPLQEVSGLVVELRSALGELKAALEHHAGSDALEEASHAGKALLPAMDVVRAAADKLEGVVSDDLWPLPTYQEMLFIL